jgi:hypothetical protein
MTDKYYVLVAGNGETSRANVEALMEDHYYAKGDNGTLVIAYESAPTKSQIYTAMYAKDCNKDIMVFCLPEAQTAGIPSASVSSSSSPIEDAVAFISGQNAVAFILWSETDDQCLKAVAICNKAGVATFDLCDGLVPLSDVKAPVSPQVTVQDVVTTPTASQPVLTASEDVFAPLETEDALEEFKAMVKEHIKQHEELLKRLG